MNLDIHRSEDRFRTEAEGRSTLHSFSFDTHYDPANISFGALICHNDDRVRPGFGYPDHPHRDLEIVTWVLSGALTHRDPSGDSGVVLPGQVRALSAGTGIVHSETVAPEAGPTRFLQTWVLPTSPGGVPSAAQANADLVTDELTLLASGADPGALVPISAEASLYAVRLATSAELPAAPRLHVFVASGAVTLVDPYGDQSGDQPAGHRLAEGDAARLTEAGGLRVSGEAELLVWSLRG